MCFSWLAMKFTNIAKVLFHLPILTVGLSQNSVANTDTTSIDLTQWTWSGDAADIQSGTSDIVLSGGDTGELLEYQGEVSEPSDWVFVEGSWITAGANNEALLLRWEGQEVVLYPTEAGWVPSINQLLFNDSLAIDPSLPFEVGLNLDAEGRISFAWNGELILDKIYPDSLSEEPPMVTVPPGYTLSLTALEWAEVVFADPSPDQEAILGSAETVSLDSTSPPLESSTETTAESVVLGDVPAPTGPPPPHPYIAMDEYGRLLSAPGVVREDTGGSVHAGGALSKGNSKRAQINQN